MGRGGRRKIASEWVEEGSRREEEASKRVGRWLQMMAVVGKERKVCGGWQTASEVVCWLGKWVGWKEEGGRRRCEGEVRGMGGMEERRGGKRGGKGRREREWLGSGDGEGRGVAREESRGGKKWQ